MSKIYANSDFAKEADYLQILSSKLNSYVQNINLWDTDKIIQLLQEISTQIENLLKQIKPET